MYYRFLVSVFAFFLCSISYAADYYWTVASPGIERGVDINKRYSSAIAASQAGIDAYKDSQLCPEKTSSSFTSSGARYNVEVVLYYCGTKVESERVGVSVVRSGDSCPTGSTYNSEDGSCSSSNPCKDMSGKEVSVARSGKAPDAFGTIVKNDKGRGSVVYPNSSCMNSCSITTSQMKCVFNTEGNYRCRGMGTYNGEQCTKGSDNTMEPGDSTSVPTPQVKESEKNCVFAPDTSGNKVCVSEKNKETEGQKCGTFNGEKVCADSDPSSVKDKTETGVATITKPDGSTVETRTDTNTTTKCEGAGDGKTNCTSTSTSTTTTTNKDSGGNTTSTDKKCEGAKCNEKETGSTGGGSSGGSGSGDGEEEGASPTTKEIKKPDSGNFEGEGDKWDKKISDAKDELKASWEKIKGNFAPISKMELSGGSGGLYCGPPVTVFEHKIDMCLTKYEAQLSWIAMAVMLICTIVALSIIFW